MRITSMTWLLALALPIVAHAQTSTGSVMTGSGANAGSGTVVITTSQILQGILNINQNAAVKNPSQLLVPDKQLNAWTKEAALIRSRINDQRTQCRDLVRRANRDEKMGKIVQCERAMLTLDASLAPKQSAFITSIPFIDPKLMSGATTALTNLQSAEMSIVDAIDTGLFTQESQLITARDNLRTTYREPVWTALLKIRADQELTNLIYISKLLNERKDVNSSSGVYDAAMCLENTVKAFQNVLGASERTSALENLMTARTLAVTCRSTIGQLSQADRQDQKIRADKAASGK